MRGHATEAGYTLIELLVVLAILGLLMTALPMLIGRGKQPLNSEAVARSLVHDLMLARDKAVAEGREQQVVVTDRGFSAASGTEERLPAGVSLSLANRAALPARLVFRPDGSASDATILVGAPQHWHRVTVHWLSGRVSLDD